MPTQTFPRCSADVRLGAGWSECVLPLAHPADHEFFSIFQSHCRSMAGEMKCVRHAGHKGWHVAGLGASVHAWPDMVEEAVEEDEKMETAPDPDAPGDLRRIMDRIYAAVEAQLVADRLRAELMEALESEGSVATILHGLLGWMPLSAITPTKSEFQDVIDSIAKIGS